jgi:hypothetical protein
MIWAVNGQLLALPGNTLSRVFFRRPRELPLSDMSQSNLHIVQSDAHTRDSSVLVSTFEHTSVVNVEPSLEQCCWDTAGHPITTELGDDV